MRFENYFVTVPVCSASRATLLTGRIPSQHGVHDFLKGPRALGADPRTFLTDEVCYTDVLAAHGWNCALSGKWHLGSSSLPQHRFSHWFAHPRGAGHYNNHDMIRNGKTVATSGYVTNVITDDALAYIDAHAADQNPFYLSVHYTAPHAPWTGHPQDIVDSYDDCAFASCPQEDLHPWAKVPKDSPFAASSGLSDVLVVHADLLYNFLGDGLRDAAWLSSTFCRRGSCSAQISWAYLQRSRKTQPDGRLERSGGSPGVMVRWPRTPLAVRGTAASSSSV